MSRVEIGDRSSVERIYPREAHDEDAAENARPKAQVHHGVRISSPGNKSAGFELTRASMHVGEAESAQDTIFLFPVRIMQAPASTGYDAAGQSTGAAGPTNTSGDAYEEFIARILDAARTADFLDPIGSGEERLKGFHGG
jgi:hypothetical protein